MKKWLCLLLTLALCLGAACGALADVTLTEIGTIEDADWIDNSNLLRVRTRDGYRLCDIAGNALTQDLYNSNLNYEFGYITASIVDGGLNSSGLLDAAGQVIMPYAYADIDILSRDWALGVKLVEATADNYDYTAWGSKDAYYLIDTVDVYNLSKGALAGTFARANFKDADVVGDILNVEDRANGVVTSYDADMNALGTVDYTWDDEYATVELTKFRENGQYGLKDAAGNVVMPASFSTIYDFYGDYATVSTGEKEGLIDKQGNVVIPAEYDDIKRGYYGPYDPVTGEDSFNAAGYFAVVKEGKLGFVDARGNVTCEPKYSEKIMELYGASATYDDMEGVTHILSADGSDVAVEGYEKIYCMDGSAGLLYRVNDADYNYGVIDWHGNVVFECTYDDIELSGDGRYLLVSEDYDTPCTLYEVGYPMAQSDAPSAPAAPSAPEAPAAPDAPQGAADARAAIAGALGRDNGEAAEGEAPATKSGLTDAKQIVGSIIALLEADAEANKATVAMLLDDVIALCEDASVQTIVTSVKTLIDTDAAANATSAVTLLHSIETLL